MTSWKWIFDSIKKNTACQVQQKRLFLLTVSLHWLIICPHTVLFCHWFDIWFEFEHWLLVRPDTIPSQVQLKSMFSRALFRFFTSKHMYVGDHVFIYHVLFVFICTYACLRLDGNSRFAWCWILWLFVVRHHVHDLYCEDGIWQKIIRFSTKMSSSCCWLGSVLASENCVWLNTFSSHLKSFSSIRRLVVWSRSFLRLLPRNNKKEEEVQTSTGVLRKIDAVNWHWGQWQLGFACFLSLSTPQLSLTYPHWHLNSPRDLISHAFCAPPLSFVSSDEFQYPYLNMNTRHSLSITPLGMRGIFYIVQLINKSIRSSCKDRQTLLADDFCHMVYDWKFQRLFI